MIIWNANKTLNRTILTNSLNRRSTERTASFTKRQPRRLLSLLKSLLQLKWLTSLLPTSVNHHEEVNISKYGETMNAVLRAISVWFVFNLECHTLWAWDTQQSQLCGAYLSLRIIIITMIVESFAQCIRSRSDRRCVKSIGACCPSWKPLHKPTTDIQRKREKVLFFYPLAE